jgi:hypothetical protein
MLIDNIKGLIMQAMKEHDSVRVTALKSILNALQVEQKSGREYNENVETATVSKLVSQYTKAIDEFKQSNTDKANELAEQYSNELDVIKEFAPKEPTTDEIEAFVLSVVDGMEKPIQMKNVMGKAKEKYPFVNGKVLADIIKKHLG